MVFSYPIPIVPCKTRFDAAERGARRGEGRTAGREARGEAAHIAVLKARSLTCERRVSALNFLA